MHVKDVLNGIIASQSAFQVLRKFRAKDQKYCCSSSWQTFHSNKATLNIIGTELATRGLLCSNNLFIHLRVGVYGNVSHLNSVYLQTCFRPIYQPDRRSGKPNRKACQTISSDWNTYSKTRNLSSGLGWQRAKLFNRPKKPEGIFGIVMSWWD